MLRQGFSQQCRHLHPTTYLQMTPLFAHRLQVEASAKLYFFGVRFEVLRAFFGKVVGFMPRVQFVGAHRFAHEWGPFLKAAFTHSRVQIAWIEV